MNTPGNGQTLVVSDPDLKLVVAWHGGTRFYVHPWLSDAEVGRETVDTFIRHNWGVEPPEPEEAVRFASEWLQSRHAELSPERGTP